MSGFSSIQDLEGYSDRPAEGETSSIDGDHSSIDDHYVQLNLLRGPSGTAVQRIRVRSQSTYGDIMAKMEKIGLHHAVLLQATYGPKPYWTKANPEVSIGDTCQTLYAVDIGNSMGYTLALVRRCDRDYPILLVDSTETTSSHRTVFEVILESNQELVSEQMAVMRYSNGDLVENEEYVRVRDMDDRLSSFPTAFFIIIGKTPDNFQLDISERSIPPFIQGLFVQCKHMVRRAYDLESCPLQVIHVSTALLHIVISLANTFQAIENTEDLDLNAVVDVLHSGPLYASQLQKFLDRIEQVSSHLYSGADTRQATFDLERIFAELCGDFPGTVAVRQSYTKFQMLSRRESGLLSRIHNEPPSEPPIPTRDDLAAMESTLEGLRSQLGDTHPDTTSYMLNLASSYYASGQYSKAQAHQAKVVERLQNQLGEIHLETLNAMITLSNIYSTRANYVQAANFQQLALEGLRMILGDQHAHVYLAQLQLSKTFYRQARYDEARQGQTIALDGLKDTLGPMHPDTFSAMEDISLTYCALGIYSEAEALQTTVLDVLRVTMGESHLTTHKAELSLASTCYRCGRYTEAFLLQERASEALRRKLGKSHPDTLVAIRDLSLTNSTIGHYSKAKEVLEKVRNRLKDKMGAAHPDTRIAELYLASIYYNQGQYHDAEPLQVSALEGLKADLGERHTTTLMAMRDLALTQCAKEKYSEAIALQETVLYSLGRVLGDGHPDTFLTKSELASTYRAKREFQEALFLYEQALEGLRRTLGDTHPETLITMLNIVAIHSATGRHSEAQNLHKDVLVHLRKQEEGMRHAGLLAAICQLASVYEMSREKRRGLRKLQRGIGSKDPPDYNLAAVLESIGSEEPDSDIDMAEGDDTSLDTDMEDAHP